MKNDKKVALITGAAHRLGRQIAIELHGRNIDIAIHCNHSLDVARQLCQYLNNLRQKSATVIQYDLQASDAAQKIITKTTNHFHQLDYIVNNASTFYPTPILKTNSASLESILRINAFQPIKLLLAAHPYLKARKGAVVNLLDIYAKRGLANHCDYVTSKAILLEATHILSHHFAPDVRINGVSPGAILWPDKITGQNPLEQQTIVDNSALKRLGKASDISQTVAYLLLDATYSTGSVINVDGGRRLYI